MKQRGLIMLRKINEGYVISNEGYKVKLGRHHVSYIEDNGYAITFETESMINPFLVVVYFSGKEPYWHIPHDLEKLTPDKLETIKNRIINVLVFLEIKYEFD
jgi:hypothetical protein